METEEKLSLHEWLEKEGPRYELNGYFYFKSGATMEVYSNKITPPPESDKQRFKLQKIYWSLRYDDLHEKTIDLNNQIKNTIRNNISPSPSDVERLTSLLELRKAAQEYVSGFDEFETDKSDSEYQEALETWHKWQGYKKRLAALSEIIQETCRGRNPAKHKVASEKFTELKPKANKLSRLWMSYTGPTRKKIQLELELDKVDKARKQLKHLKKRELEI